MACYLLIKIMIPFETCYFIHYTVMVYNIVTVHLFVILYIHKLKTVPTIGTAG